MSKGSKGAVRRGVGVPANYRHTRQGRALLRTYHVHNSLPRIIDLKLHDIEVLAVLVQCLHLQAGHRISNRCYTAAALLPLGGNVVIGHRQVRIASPRLATGEAQPLKSLR